MLWGGTSIIGAGNPSRFIWRCQCRRVSCGIDLALARQGVSGAFSGNRDSLATDVDQSGAGNETDLQLIQDYLLGKITEFRLQKK